MASPAALRDAARALRSIAGRAGDALGPVAAATGPAVWQGKAADKLVVELAGCRRTMAGVPASLYATASELDRRAAAIEATVAAAATGG